MTGNGHVTLLLAAGSSRRLGRPKQLLKQNGETLVRVFAQCALATGPKRLFVVIGAESAAIKAELADIELECIDNPDWASGLASSLRVAAPALLEAGLPVLVLGCDQPALSPGHLQALLAAESPPGGVVVSRYGGDGSEDGASGLPVLAPLSLFAELGTLSGDQGLKSLWRTRPQRAVPAPELALDLDTEADVAEAIRRGWLDPGPD